MRLPSDVALEAADTTFADRRIARAYRRIVDDFWRVLRDTGAYEKALQRALAGDDREIVRAYLRGYLAAYFRRPGERILPTRDAFADAWQNGYEQGGQDQLSMWGFRGERFSLTDRGTLLVIANSASIMAAVAVDTLDDTLLDQATSSALGGMKKPDLNPGPLAAVSAFALPNRGYNHGRGETARRSTNDELRKRWAVLGSAQEPREHHQAIEGMTIFYHDLFPIAGGVMWPHDWDRAGPAEWMFCRHFAEYLPAEGADIDPWWGDDVGDRLAPI